MWAPVLDVGSEVGAVLEVEHRLSALLDRHGELHAHLLGFAGDAAAHFLVDEDACFVARGTGVEGGLEPIPHQTLGVLEAGVLVGGGLAGDPEHLLAEAAAMVEREDEQGSVVAEGHDAPEGSLPFDCTAVA